MNGRQEAVHRAVAAYWRDNAHAPSITDLEEATGIGRAYVHECLQALAAEGAVLMTPGVPRTVRLATDDTAIRRALQPTT